jgi:negative regulator of replication initiation
LFPGPESPPHKITTDSPFLVFSNEKDESDVSFLNQIMIIMMYAIQIIESVHIFHKTYKKSQTNIRHQVLKKHE